MDPDEITLFQLYQTQHNSPNGRDRDDLPYTAEFAQLRQQYNQATGQTKTDREFWLMLKYVTKYGIPNINRFLAQHGGGNALTAGS